jgi:protease-4
MTIVRNQAWLLAAAACVAACSINNKEADDPWAGGSGAGSGSGSAAKRPASDMDTSADNLKQMVKNIVDNLDKPGPFEAPDQSRSFDDAKPHWGVATLSGKITETESFSWTGGRGVELRGLIDRIHELAKDPKLDGMLLRVSDLELSIPDAAELRAALADLRAAGKHLACHAEVASNTTYVLMTSCERIGLAPLGEIVLSGPTAMPIHLKGLLDKVGITADFMHVGAYKGAAEPLTRDAPSPEMVETLDAILSRRYDTIVAWVAAGRGVPADAVKGLIDTAIFPAPDALAAKLVDQVATWESFRDGVTGGAWTRLPLKKKDDPITAMKRLAEFVGMMPIARPSAPHVAVVYAVGDVVDGDGDGLLGARERIASHTLTAALDTLADDDSVKAVVLRIDSGGGSALASELIWHAVHELVAKKPVIVSMSDVAASGGYYIASGATRIFALDDTLTGSIGVVGGKLAVGGALARFGVTSHPMGKGKRATMFARLDGWTDDEKAAIFKSMDATYKVFVQRVADGRHKTPEQIQPIAQGRVWTGAKAKELGLVDELGGLSAAIAYARTAAALPADAPLEIYPPRPTLRDIVATFGGVRAPFGLSSSLTELAETLSPQAAAVVEHTLWQLVGFQQARIQTALLLPVVLN